MNINYLTLILKGNEIIEELRNAEYTDLEDMAFRMELTYGETAEIFDTKHIAISSTRYTLPTGTYKFSDLSLILMPLLPDDVEVDFTIFDIRL